MNFYFFTIIYYVEIIYKMIEIKISFLEGSKKMTRIYL